MITKGNSSTKSLSLGEREIVIIMVPYQERGEHPPNLPIDPFGSIKGLPILVPRDLAVLEMLAHLPKFYETKDEDFSRHMDRYIEGLANSLITNPGYCLEWFLTIMQGEA